MVEKPLSLGLLRPQLPGVKSSCLLPCCVTLGHGLTSMSPFLTCKVRIAIDSPAIVVGIKLDNVQEGSGRTW